MTTHTPSKVMHISDCVTTLDWLRHGETQGDDIFRGSTDVPLSTAGWEQMHQAVDSLRPWQFLVSSPLKRCAEFTMMLGKELAINPYLENHMSEICFGEWEGKKPQEVWQTSPEAMRAFWEDADQFPPPGGERLSDFYARVIDGFNNVIDQFRGQHGLIVCHGGIIRMVIAHILSMPLQAAMRIQVPYACVSRIIIYHHATEPDVMSLDFHNGSIK